MHACRSWCWPLSSHRPSSLTTFLHIAPVTWVAAVNHLYKVTLVWTAWPWLVHLHVCPWHAMFISGSEISHLMPHRPLVVWRWKRWLVSTCWEAFIVYMLHKSHLEGLLSSAVQYQYVLCAFTDKLFLLGGCYHILFASFSGKQSLDFLGDLYLNSTLMSVVIYS